MSLICAVTPIRLFIFFFNDTATTEIYTLSLHDALPIYDAGHEPRETPPHVALMSIEFIVSPTWIRSEEHTSELQSRQYLVCRLLLEKKKKKTRKHIRRTEKTTHENRKESTIQTENRTKR